MTSNVTQTPVADLHPITAEILHEPPSTEFLEKTEGTVDGKTLARIVREVRQVAQMPPRLFETCRSFLPAVIDVCGTGGSKGHRLNTSTLTALLAPSLGIGVVKHGGRSASGKLGSLDLLEKLGLDLNSLYQNAAESLRTQGLAYLGARFTYECFGKYAPVRKAFGRPTLFNLLGPLLNPVQPHSRILGAFDDRVAALIADAVAELGESAFVVVSKSGEAFLDEASPFGETLLIDVSRRGTRRFHLAALEASVPPLQTLFADAGGVALRMIEGHDDDACQAARKLVAYNLAIASFLERDISESDFCAALPSTYQAILATFPARCQAARTRLAAIRALAPEHPKTPVRVPNSLVADHARGASTSKTSRAQAAVQSAQESRGAFAKFATADATSPGWLVAEVKLRTPTREFPSFSLAERVHAYEAADAISVVTHPSFGGSLGLLAQVRALTTKPILAKDFIRSKDEVEALARAGADGVLILEDMLTPEVCIDLIHACAEEHVTPFLESTWQVPRTQGLSTQIVPVLNSRNLFTLLEGRDFRDALGFSHRAGQVLYASGASSPAEVALFRKAGRGIIVGTDLMKMTSRGDIDAYLRRCSGSRLFLKVCGAVKSDDVELALSLGADFVGVNLIPTSKRFVSLSALKCMRDTLAKHSERIVLLTSEQTPLEHLHEVCGLEVTEQPYGAPLLCNRRGVFSTSAERLWLGTRTLILDGSSPGSGVAEKYRDKRREASLPVLAAGGVKADNVFARLAEARSKGFVVAGVDVASGVEDEAGGANRFSRKRIENLREELARCEAQDS